MIANQVTSETVRKVSRKLNADPTAVQKLWEGEETQRTIADFLIQLVKCENPEYTPAIVWYHAGRRFVSDDEGHKLILEFLTEPVPQAVKIIASHFEMVEDRNRALDAGVPGRNEIWRRCCTLLTLSAVYECAGWVTLPVAAGSRARVGGEGVVDRSVRNIAESDDAYTTLASQIVAVEGKEDGFPMLCTRNRSTHRKRAVLSFKEGSNSRLALDEVKSDNDFGIESYFEGTII